MIKRSATPTDQTASASSTDGVGAPGTDDAQADPVSGNRKAVVLVINSTLSDAGGGTPSIRYTTDGVSYTTVRSGGTGSFTDTVTVGNVDTTNLAVQARAQSGPGTSSTSDITSWTVQYDLPGLIGDVG